MIRVEESLFGYEPDASEQLDACLTIDNYGASHTSDPVSSWVNIDVEYSTAWSAPLEAVEFICVIRDRWEDRLTVVRLLDPFPFPQDDRTNIEKRWTLAEPEAWPAAAIGSLLVHPYRLVDANGKTAAFDLTKATLPSWLKVDLAEYQKLPVLAPNAEHGE